MIKVDAIDRYALIEALKAKKQQIASSSRLAKKKGKWWECYRAIDPLIRVIQRAPSLQAPHADEWKAIECPDEIEKCNRQWPQYSFEAHVSGDTRHTCCLNVGHQIPCVCSKAHE